MAADVSMTVLSPTAGQPSAARHVMRIAGEALPPELTSLPKRWPALAFDLRPDHRDG
jgi:hypothetical protein